MDQGNRLSAISDATLLTGVSDEDHDSQLENRACKRRGCRARPLDDSEFCRPHDEAQKRYNREYDQRRRERWEAEGKCTRCGADQRKRDSMWCAACLIRLGKVRKSDLKQQLENRAQRIAERLIPWENSPQNEGRLRLRGGKRGAPSGETVDEADISDLRIYIEKASQGLSLANSDEVQAMPRIQRDEAKQAAMAWVALLVRAGLVMLKRKRYPLPAEMDHVLGLAAK